MPELPPALKRRSTTTRRTGCESAKANSVSQKVRDNFFELGGTHCWRCVCSTYRENGWAKKLPLTTVFRSNVEHLASVLRQQADPARSPRWCPFNPVAANSHSSSCIRLATCFAPTFIWRQFLAPDQPLYGLQARGLKTDKTPTPDRRHGGLVHPSPADRAADRAVLFGRMVHGRRVAFEMAQQLHAQGQRVALLALLDGRIPLPTRRFRRKMLTRLVVERYFGISFGPMESLAKLPKDEQLAFMLETGEGRRLGTGRA